MEERKTCGKTKLIVILILFFLCVALEGATIKIKVKVDNARIKETSEVVGKTLARVPLNTILNADPKQGEWYKVYLNQGGTQITGFIYVAYVEEVTGTDVPKEAGFIPPATRIQTEMVVGIEAKVDEAKKTIREDKDPGTAVYQLRPLLAKVFKVTDNNRQRELAAEIYLWLGLAHVEQNDDFSALQEFRNMFEIDHAYAKEMTGNYIDEKVISLLKQAEDIFQGKQIEYSIDIITNPSGVKVKINGVDKQKLTPLTYKVKSEIGPPKFILGLEKEGYKPLSETIILLQPHIKKTYIMEALTRDLELVSIPGGASVFLDDQDTGKKTPCTLPGVKTGTHKIRLVKNGYNDRNEEIPVEEGASAVKIEIELTAKEYSYLSKYGDPSQSIFSLPKALALDNNNNVYIIDTSKNKVIKMNSQFQPQTGWGDKGKEFRSLKDPACIAVDSGGNLYITDVKNHNVNKFDSSGRSISKWGKMGIDDEGFNSPLGIAVDSENNVYVADSRNHRVKKYSSAGQFKKTWGQRGSQPGTFMYPAAIAISPNNEVYVVDRNRIQKFTSEGVLISSWGQVGQGDGEIQIPLGIAVDSDNNIYVADSSNNRIQKFDENGKFIIKWGSKGAGNGQFSFPAGIAVDSRGYIFVLERDNQRIQVFGIVPD